MTLSTFSTHVIRLRIDGSMESSTDQQNTEPVPTERLAQHDAATDVHDDEEDAGERLARSRERNREHARRTRLRKKAQLQVLQGRVKELQEELTNTEIEATSADGGVTVTISGAQVPIAVTVSDELLAQGADAVSDAVTVAVGEAHKNSVEYAKGRMSELYKDIGLPMDPNAMG